MAAPRPQGQDFGAALAGLVLGSSVIFLVVLMIVWLTNSKFERHRAETATHASPPASAAAAPGAASASTTPAATPPVTDPAVKH